MRTSFHRATAALAVAAVTLVGIVSGTAQAATTACTPYGDIARKYQAFGGASSRLGACTTDEFGVAKGGRAEFFQGGAIYWTPRTGAQVLVGGILGQFAASGWENSPLGFPTTDEFGPLVGGGYGQHFEGGSVYWTPSAGGVTVRGPLRDAWAAAGWERSPLGYPTGAELTLEGGNGAVQPFQGGLSYWSKNTGAHSVRGAILGTFAQRGYEWGDLGYPVSDEYDIAGGRRSDFQYGIITWDAASGATTVTTTGSRFRKVTVIGDSLTFGACGETAQRVPADTGTRGVACFGWPGATSDEMQAYTENSRFRSAWPNMLLPMPGVDLKSAIAGSDVLVVGLGTNDALRDRAGYNTRAWPQKDIAPVPSGHVPVDNGYFDQKIDYFLKLAGGKPVYWYDLGYNGHDSTVAYYFSHRNERLHLATRRWPNLHVLNWSGAVRANPGMMIDDVHVNAAGNSVRWGLLRNALR